MSPRACGRDSLNLHKPRVYLKTGQLDLDAMDKIKDESLIEELANGTIHGMPEPFAGEEWGRLKPELRGLLRALLIVEVLLLAAAVLVDRHHRHHQRHQPEQRVPSTCCH